MSDNKKGFVFTIGPSKRGVFNGSPPSGATPSTNVCASNGQPQTNSGQSKQDTQKNK